MKSILPLKLPFIALDDTGCMVNSVEIRCSRDGPNLIVVDGNVFAAMCRCGASANKPQCDGSHRKINFKAEEKTIRVV